MIKINYPFSNIWLMFKKKKLDSLVGNLNIYNVRNIIQNILYFHD